MKIKYVGLKPDGETAFAREAGITAWMPGDSIEITNPGVVQKMLQHPDVFAVDQSKPVKSLAPTTTAVIEPMSAIESSAVTLAPGSKVTPVVDLQQMDRAALHSMAKELGIKVHYNAGAETVRKAIEAHK